MSEEWLDFFQNSCLSPQFPFWRIVEQVQYLREKTILCLIHTLEEGGAGFLFWGGGGGSPNHLELHHFLKTYGFRDVRFTHKKFSTQSNALIFKIAVLVSPRPPTVIYKLFFRWIYTKTDAYLILQTKSNQAGKKILNRSHSWEQQSVALLTLRRNCTLQWNLSSI